MQKCDIFIKLLCKIIVGLLKYVPETNLCLELKNLKFRETFPKNVLRSHDTVIHF